jgi:hypothetical protein
VAEKSVELRRAERFRVLRRGRFGDRRRARVLSAEAEQDEELKFV